MKQITPSEMRSYLYSEPPPTVISNELIQNIHSMEPHTAYALLGGYFAPLLHTGKKQSAHFPSLSPDPPSSFESMAYSPSKSATVSLSTVSKETLGKIDTLQKKFKEIEDILLDLQKNARTILQFKGGEETVDTYKKIKELWDYGKSHDEKLSHIERLELYKGIMGRFSTSKSLILHKLEELKQLINGLGQSVPESLLHSLQKARKNLLEQIPKGSNKLGTWVFPWQRVSEDSDGNGGFSLREITSEGEGAYHIDDPRGLLEMALDPKKFKDYLAPMRNAFHEISLYKTPGPGQAHLLLQRLKNDFSKIQNLLKELNKNGQKIIDYWIDSSESKPIDDQTFRDFYYLREKIQNDLEKIKEDIAQLEKVMPQSKAAAALIAKLKQIHSDLVKKIPEPSQFYGKDSSYWKPKGDFIVDTKGKEKDHGMRFWWKENTWDKAKVAKWKNSGDETLPENPLGFLEMVISADRTAYNDFLEALSKAKDSINDFYKTTESKPLHIFLLKNMDTQTAYIYMVVILLPLLQNQAAEGLEEQGNTMKQVSNLYNKWNEIQEKINEMSALGKELKKEQIIQDNKFNIWKIIDFDSKDSNGKYIETVKVVKMDDPNGVFRKVFALENEIKKKVKEFQKLLEEVSPKLPASSQSLIETLRKLAPRLILGDPEKEKQYKFYYWDQDGGEMRFEIPAELAKLKDNEDYDRMNEVIFEYTKDKFGLFLDSDQTKFKNYMDNIGQGITALTSISNMTQQQLQIDTQYYNSLLGLQKSAQDSLNKTIQAVLNSMR